MNATFNNSFTIFFFFKCFSEAIIRVFSERENITQLILLFKYILNFRGCIRKASLYKELLLGMKA